MARTAFLARTAVGLIFPHSSHGFLDSLRAFIGPVRGPHGYFRQSRFRGVDFDLATAVRTVVVLLLAWGIVRARGADVTLPALSSRT